MFLDKRAAVFGGLLAVLLLCVLPSPPRVTLFSKRHRLNSQTTFINFWGCSRSQRDALIHAHQDAVSLAEAALEDDRELVTTGVSQYINFDTVAAIEYFGPPNQNTKWRQRIFDTFYRATNTYPGWGWSDWWYQRYVEVACGKPTGTCASSFAYTQNWVSKSTKSRITYCPKFFEGIESYAQMLERVKNSGPDRRKNLSNMLNQGAIALHEWLHIVNSPAEVCESGCRDLTQKFNNVPMKTYGPGQSKLLAKRSTKAAAYNNNNYVWFAVCRQMEKLFGEYPLYPSSWDINKSIGQNQEKEDKEPGSRPWPQITEAPTEEDEVISDALYPDSDYPSWYLSLMKGKSRRSALNLFEPFHEPSNFSTPPIDNVVCETNRYSGLASDCVNAFEKLYANPEAPVKKGKQGHWNWEGHTKSCAIAVNYTGDWSNCEANLGDIRAHASTIFEACRDGCRRGVAGHVPFSRVDCPGIISIIPTENKRPPGEKLYTFIKNLVKDSRLFNWNGV